MEASNGGMDCQGPETQNESCNRHPCKGTLLRYNCCYQLFTTTRFISFLIELNMLCSLSGGRGSTDNDKGNIS